MVRWCIRLTRLTLVYEVIRYSLAQVRQNLKKKTFRVGCPQSQFSFSSFFILSFVLVLSFSIQKKKKEININLVYSSCLKHANKMRLGDPRQADQRTMSFHFPIVIHLSLDPAARALKSQAPCLYMHSSTRQAQNASTRRVYVYAPSR